MTSTEPEKIFYFQGKPVNEMTREELIAAIKILYSHIQTLRTQIETTMELKLMRQ